MLSDESFSLWCKHLGLDEEAKSIIAQIRSSPPNRRVKGGGSSVVGFYPSRKMGVTIQFESHKNELAAILTFEYDEDVIEYYDQPFPPLRLEYKSANNRHITAWHTSDFFVIYRQSAGWIECKTEQQLNKLVQTQPTRYIHNEDGTWNCPPGEQYAKELGLKYWIRSSSENKKIYLRNIEFLEDYFRSETLDIPDDIEYEINTIVKEYLGITFDQLLKSSTNITPDYIYSLIAMGHIYTDLETISLTDQEKVSIYSNKDQFIRASRQISKFYIGQELKWNERRWIVGQSSNEEITLVDEEGTFSMLSTNALSAMVKEGMIKLTSSGIPFSDKIEGLNSLANATLKDLQTANERYNLIKKYLTRETEIPQGVKRSTFYRWLAHYRKAELIYGNGFIGLLSHYYSSGNNKAKLQDRAKAIMVKYIENTYETIKQKPMLEVYGALLCECELVNIPAPSYKTFTKEIKRRFGQEQILKRQGPRAAYKAESFYWDLEVNTPRHGDRPFHICHIDHTELDIELVCSRTGKNLGRPWLTLMTDAFSRRILSAFLTFDPPSYRSCMMSIRECVRKHGRFAQILVVDGGREFDGIYYQTLLARYECIKKVRPEAKSRFGSVIERLFGTTNTQLIHNLTGNTQLMKNVRQITKSVNPKNLAIWNIGLLYERLCEYVYEVYDTIIHPALGQCPRDAFTDGLIRYGFRSHRYISYDSEFRILTCPTTAKATARVLPGKGVKINNIYYWSNTFRNPVIERTEVPVRYDPYDVGIAFAFVGKRWVSCISEYYTRFHGHTEREVLLLSAELRKRNYNHSKQFTITAKKIAEFLATTEADEILLLQQLKDKEAKSIIKIIEGGLSEKVSDLAIKQKEVDGSGEEEIDYNKFVDYEVF